MVFSPFTASLAREYPLNWESDRMAGRSFNSNKRSDRGILGTQRFSHTSRLPFNE